MLPLITFLIFIVIVYMCLGGEWMLVSICSMFQFLLIVSNFFRYWFYPKRGEIPEGNGRENTQQSNYNTRMNSLRTEIPKYWTTLGKRKNK